MYTGSGKGRGGKTKGSTRSKSTSSTNNPTNTGYSNNFSDNTEDSENHIVCNCNQEAKLLTVRKEGQNQGTSICYVSL